MRALQPGIVLDVAPARPCAQAHAVGSDADCLQRLQLSEIDQHRGRGEPKRHRGQQALAAGERLGRALARREQRYGFGKRRRSGVFEIRKFHFSTTFR
jgi:hypothetical protein